MVANWKGITQRTAISKDSQEHPYIFKCSQPYCYYAVSAIDHLDAELKAARHSCPWVGGITHFGGSMTLTLVEQLWEKADSAYDLMISTRTEDANYANNPMFREARGEVVGLSKALAVFMTPHFSTTREIADELVRRAKARNSGEKYETKGLASRRYELPRAEQKVTKRAFTAQETASIKTALKSKLLSPKELASMYKCSEADIEIISCSLLTV